MRGGWSGRWCAPGWRRSRRWWSGRRAGSTRKWIGPRVAGRARIVRRPSGGLTVILGPGCVMWSVVAPLSPESQPPIARLHAALLDPLAAALVAAGRPVVRRGSSDLAVRVGDGERKVSGNALRVRRGAVLYHGTLLDDFDLELVSRLLRHPPREPDYRAGRHHAAFLANLSLGRAALDEAVRQAFAAREPLTAWPADRVAELCATATTAPPGRNAPGDLPAADPFAAKGANRARDRGLRRSGSLGKPCRRCGMGSGSMAMSSRGRWPDDARDGAAGSATDRETARDLKPAFLPGAFPGRFPARSTRGRFTEPATGGCCPCACT